MPELRIERDRCGRRGECVVNGSELLAARDIAADEKLTCDYRQFDEEQRAFLPASEPAPERRERIVAALRRARVGLYEVGR